MLVEDAGVFLDHITDEDDPTFLTPAFKTIILKTGYDRFRSIVRAIDPNIYNARVTITLTGEDFYDLADAGNAVVIMGPVDDLTDTRLATLERVSRVDPSSGAWIGDYKAAADFEELRTFNDSIWYLLAGTTIFLGGTLNGSIRLNYVPVSTVDWTKLTTGDDERIDELEEWHDLIPALGYAVYASKDGAGSAVVERMLTVRQAEFKTFLNAGRAPQQGDHGVWAR